MIIKKIFYRSQTTKDMACTLVMDLKATVGAKPGVRGPFT